jgi:omega-hydroxy-beta-dihydromenaquinone-9 sulfotransferase
LEREKADRPYLKVMSRFSRGLQPLAQQAVPGMKLSTLFQVLLRNRMRVNWRYLPRLAFLLAVAGLNSYLGCLEAAVDGENIAGAQLVGPPIFILGYWRSGTTHLHNLLNCDPNLACPTSYQAMFPHHFVYTQPWGAGIFNAFTPGKRPMDNVAIYDATPHEEEMALAALCGVSPYMLALFPATGDGAYAAVDPAKLPAGALADWQANYRLFLKKLSFSRGRRLVLKSPPHLGRLPILLNMFPGAKFIHIVRNPYAVYLSSQKLWSHGLAYSHLQKADPGKLDELILSWYTELYALFERDRRLIPPGSLFEMRFEDLETSPRQCLQRLYTELDLPNFAGCWQGAAEYLGKLGKYKKNRHRLGEEDRARVSRRWVFNFARYGYPLIPPLGPGETVSFS